MQKFLPIAWICLIPVLALIRIFALLPMFPSLGAMSQLSNLVTIVPGALLFACFALIYAIFLRITASIWVFGLGWAHFVFTALSDISGTYTLFARTQIVAGGDRIQFQDIAIWSGVSGITSLLAHIAFFAAVFIAFQSTRKRIELQTFD